MNTKEFNELQDKIKERVLAKIPEEYSKECVELISSWNNTEI